MTCFVGYRTVMCPLRTFKILAAGKLMLAFLPKFISAKATNYISQTMILLNVLLILPTKH